MIPVKIDDLKSGMILAQPVRNAQGVLLLDTGARITKKNIRIFKSWGVNEVSVKGDISESKTGDEPPVAPVKKSVEMELKEKFSDVMADPVMRAIFTAAANQLTRNLLNNENENEHS
jgi:hypothetical protein